MKLHLPVGLRTALLAALASFSVAFGQITVKQSITEESEGSDVDVTDGTLNDTLQGDVLIEVDGTDGDATLSLSGDISQDATTTITVGEGGEIKTTGRLTIGTAGSLQEDPGKESVTIINVNGGKFDASASSSLVIGWGNGQDSVSRTTINVSDGGSFILGQYCTIGDTYRGNSHSETVINVTGGGTFRNNKGEIGRAGWSTAFDSPHTATTVNTITVEGEGSRFIDTGYAVGSTEGNALEARTTINVKNGGTYTTRPDASEQYKYPKGNLAIASTSGTEGNAVVLAINLEDGKFLFDGNIASAASDNTSSEATITLSGDSYFEITGNVSTGGGIGAAAWQSPESTVSVNVQAGSTFKIVSNSYNGLGYSTGSTKDATIKVGIEIDDGTFEITGNEHAFIGTINADEWSSPSGEAEVKISVHGSEKGKGKFTMSTGELSWKGTSVESHTTLDVDLTGYAEMTITGGKIGGDEGETTIDLYDNATLTLTTPNENISEYLVVTLHGGNLGAGFTGNKVAIDTAEGFTGAIDLGGLDASKITQEFTRKVQNTDTGEYTYESVKGFRIGGPNTRITGLQASTTLTLTGNQEGGYDNFIMVGTDSAYLKTGGGKAPEGYGALIEFKDESGTVKLESGTQITLDFSGKLLDGALSGAEDGNVEIEVWFTNGTLTLGDEEGRDPNDFFVLGNGWGLYTTAVKNSNGEATGKLLITGNIDNVWMSTKQLTEKESDVLVGELSSVTEKFTKVVIDADTKLTSTADGGRLEQLEGGQSLHIAGEGEVTLDNSQVTAFSKGTLDSTLKGTLTTEENVNLRKTGGGKLTLEGGLTAGGNVTVAQGTLAIGGAESSIAGKLDMAAEGTLQVTQDGQLTLSGESDLTAGTLTGEGAITVAEGGSLTVGEEATLGKALSLQVDGDLTLHGKHLRDSSEDGTITGSGTLTVAEGGELSIEADSEWTLEVSDIHVAGTLSQKKSPITAENIVVQAGGKWTLESDASYSTAWSDTVTQTVAQNITVENTGTVEQKGSSVSADTITVAGTWTQDKITLTDDSTAPSWNKNHDVHAETRANSLVVQAGGNYNLMDGAISALGGADDEPGTLDLQVSGTFEMSGGTIAEKGDVAIDVEQGGAFTMSDGNVATGGNANIIVEQGGEFKIDGFGNVTGADYKGDSQARISIRGGDFTLSGGTSIGNASTYSWDEKQSCTSTVTIEITEDGGNFTLSGNGQIGIASGRGDESDVTINVKGGKFLVQNENSTQSSLGEVQQASDAGYTNKVEIGINVSGNGQFVLAEGGIGCADFASQANGQCSASTKITVTDSGSFTMEGGNLGCKLSDSASLSTALHIELSDQGQMQISGGKVGEGATLKMSDEVKLTLDSEGKVGEGATLEMSDEAKFTLGAGGKIGEGATIEISDASTFTLDATEEDATNNLSIMMHGGSLAGEGIANLQGTVAIDMAEGFTGAIDLGGLDASRITQEFTRKVQNADTGEYTSETVKGFRIREADTHITGLQAGTTLTLSGQDGVDGYHNSIMVGNSSAWMGNDTAIPAEKSALIEFQDGEEKGKIHFTEGSKFFLDFSGELVGELHEGQVEVNIQVYFTNGELTFGSGDVKDYFALGAGWGLQVKEYTMTPNGGLLTITGDMSNVAVLDGEESKMDDLDGKEAVVVIDDTILDSTDGGKLEHLTGDGDLTITGEGEVTLENNPDKFGLGETTFRGKLTTDSGINLHKTGSENLTLSGGLEAKGGLAVDEGGLVLAGQENTNTVGGTLTVGGAGTSGTLDVQGNLDAKDVDVQNGRLTLSGGNNTVGGSLTVGDAESGTEGTLDVQGNLDAKDVDVQNGKLTLSGGETTVGGSLTVGGAGTSGTLDVQGNLNAKDVDVQNGTLTFGESSENSIGGELTLGEKGALQVDGKLTLSGKSDLSEAGDRLSGDGTIVVDDGGSLKLDSKMLGVPGLPAIDAKAGSTLEFADTDPVAFDLVKDMTCTVAGDFTSTGDNTTFAGSVDGTLTVDGGSLNMSNTANGGCNLVVEGEGAQVTIAAGSTYNSIDNHGRLSTSTPEGTEKARITATGDIIFRNGAHSPVDIDLNEPELSQGRSVEEINYESIGGKIIIEQHTELDVTLTGNILDAKGDLNVVIMEAAEGIENPEKYEKAPANYKMRTVRFMAKPQAEGEWTKVTAEAVVTPGEGVDAAVMNQLYDVSQTEFWTDGKQLLTYIPQRTESPWEQYATTSNSRAGLALLYRDLHQNGVMGADQDVVALINGIEGLVKSNPAEARRALAAVAGSTLTSVSAAQSAALRNQTSRVRDHALQAARLRCAGNDEATQQQRPCKTTHVWVEGTSFFSEQHSIGDESGYRLNSWGGAVGIDAQVNAHWSVGLSLAANYGDLEARAADYAKGDLDSYYVSAWSQAKNGRWGNTLLFTVGTNEADLRRTVNYGASSYTATSSASGSSLGAMWELTCDFHPVKENKSNILQPLFNVAVQHTSMDGFSEKNAGGVGLATEKQTRDTMTLGLGLRWLAAIDSAKAVNRTVSTELHANVAQDLGDRRSVANVALLTDPNFTQSVYGSKTGSTAFQFGAGVNVPMTPNSCIYVNAGGELREHANTWSATLGVRMGF